MKKSLRTLTMTKNINDEFETKNVSSKQKKSWSKPSINTLPIERSRTYDNFGNDGAGSSTHS
jgi:hypothetical protein